MTFLFPSGHLFASVYLAACVICQLKNLNIAVSGNVVTGISGDGEWENNFHTSEARAGTEINVSRAGDGDKNSVPSGKRLGQFFVPVATLHADAVSRRTVYCVFEL